MPELFGRMTKLEELMSLPHASRPITWDDEASCSTHSLINMVKNCAKPSLMSRLGSALLSGKRRKSAPRKEPRHVVNFALEEGGETRTATAASVSYCSTVSRVRRRPPPFSPPSPPSTPSPSPPATLKHYEDTSPASATTHVTCPSCHTTSRVPRRCSSGMLPCVVEEDEKEQCAAAKNFSCVTEFEAPSPIRSSASELSLCQTDVADDTNSDTDISYSSDSDTMEDLSIVLKGYKFCSA